jgi:predicted amidophosphoribosyltransferase
MALLLCRLCAKPFNGMGAKLCPRCAQDVDSVYVSVRKYIYQNPSRASFAAIVEELQISDKILSYLIDEGRIVLEGEATRSPRCRACGAETSDGPLCDRCRNKLISEKLMSGCNRAEKPAQDPELRKAQPLRIQKL